MECSHDWYTSCNEFQMISASDCYSCYYMESHLNGGTVIGNEECLSPKTASTPRIRCPNGFCAVSQSSYALMIPVQSAMYFAMYMQ